MGGLSHKSEYSSMSLRVRLLSTMKTVAITVGEDIIVRNILQTEFLALFLDYARKENWKVIFIVSEKTEMVVRSHARHANVIVYRRDNPSKIENIIMTLARSAIDTHTNLWSKMRSYKRGDSSYVATVLKRIHTALLGDFSWYKRLLRFLIERLPSDRRAHELFDQYNPDIFVPLSLTSYDFDVPLAREAKKRKIPILGMVRSWDNLSSHGLLRIVPDVFFLQNAFLKEMALLHQALDERKVPIHIVGLPHYDAYMRPRAIPWEKLCTLLGLDSSKKIILYGAMGSFLFKHEHDMPRILDRVIEHTRLSETAQVLYRAHPKFILKDEFATLPNVILSTPTSYTAKEHEYTSEDVLISTIVHADVVITCGSTFAIDAIILGRPVICISFDGEQTADYWESAARFYDLYTHYEAFIETSKTPVAKNEKELAQMILNGIKRGNCDRQTREAVIRRFAPWYEGGSAKRLADSLRKEILKIS